FAHARKFDRHRIILDRTFRVPVFSDPLLATDLEFTTGEFPLMATATTTHHLGATALLGKGLTPGKLRGLQRISNANGTLTMLALDQNSSMIEMAQKALKAKGENREPTYQEIVEAKLAMMRQMAPAASGVLIDAYYGAWPAIASEALPPDKGMLVRVEKSGSPKNKIGGPMVEIEA